MKNFNIKLTVEEVEILSISVYEKREELLNSLNNMNRESNDPIRLRTEKTVDLLFEMYLDFEEYLEEIEEGIPEQIDMYNNEEFYSGVDNE